MFDFELSLAGNFTVFCIAAVVIGFAGARASRFADQLADSTGWGEALTGTIFLGFMTALPGFIASLVTAMKGMPALAISNALGGIAIQTAALGVADIAYKRANLEHAAASVPNMMQTVMLLALLVLVLLGLSSPDVTVGHVHPASILQIIVAACAFVIVVRVRQDPMWKPVQTDETRVDRPNEDYVERDSRKLGLALLVVAALTALSGAVIAEAAQNIVEQTDFSEILVGGLLMAVATSLPELVTSVAAVREGALTLAVSDIVGGNFFDVLFVAGADIVFLSGSIYHAGDVGMREVFLATLTILLNLILLAGLIFRQREGPGRIGIESSLMLGCYVIGFIILSLSF
ncbi:sodium:calcium antiporter [Rubinisphaera margarita]|uniref:sodium:calcium antiporter n=1 Tax=Rubinisphaera margarita TaxID=2909586 RepID=UPI001EE79197|nr:hypothetical protein [Rubinisphaera margarita]MCG6154608.1 hypothetical protein [Rubinisphaera margarita]